jgi:NitT/TauT family transport system substrate-binding protein
VAHRRLFLLPLALLLVAAVSLVGCDEPIAAPQTPGASGVLGGTSEPPPIDNATLTVGLGYIPSVQFAPFYRAQLQGYYEQAGLTMTFQNDIDTNLVTLLGQGAIDVGMADGTSVIPAVAQDIPVKYAATVYALFPNVVMTGADSGIESAADLEGKTIGIPGRYGSSWVMLQALLASADLTADDVEIREYSDYGQAVALQQGQVDAATGFANNEPIVLADQGFETNVLTIDDITPLPGPGLTVGAPALANKPNQLRAFIEQTLRAMDEITEDPALGVDAAIQAVPELAEDRELQEKILDATIAMWSSEYTAEHGTGAIDVSAWQESLDFMSGLPDTDIPSDLTTDDLVTEELLP